MYQLGHFLAEQKSILSSQQDMSLFGTQGDMFKYFITVCLRTLLVVTERYSKTCYFQKWCCFCFEFFNIAVSGTGLH